MRILENAQVEYEVYEYPPPAQLDATTIAQTIDKPVEQTFKTLVTQAPTQQHGFEHFVFVIPANAELSVKKAAVAAGVKN